MPWQQLISTFSRLVNILKRIHCSIVTCWGYDLTVTNECKIYINVWVNRCIADYYSSQFVQYIHDSFVYELSETRLQTAARKALSMRPQKSDEGKFVKMKTYCRNHTVLSSESDTLNKFRQILKETIVVVIHVTPGGKPSRGSRMLTDKA